MITQKHKKTKSFCVKYQKNSESSCRIDLVKNCWYNKNMEIKEVIKRDSSLGDIIKAYFYKKNASKWILQRAKKFDALSYFLIKKRLKSIKYQFLEEFDTNAASYSPTEHRIGIFGHDNITLDTILHEMLHACSNNEDEFLGFNINDTTFGLMGRYNNYMLDDNINCFFKVDFGKAINEAATEFFTYDILHSKNKEYPQDSIYTHLVNIFAIFCTREKDGKVAIDSNIKNKLFEFYMKGKYNNFVDYLSNIYNSPKSQVQMLMFQFDKVLELIKEESPLNFDMLIRCYNTLYEMQYNRFAAKHQNATLDDFLNSSEIKEMVELLPSRTSYNVNKIAKEMFIKKFKNYQFGVNETNGLSSFVMNYCFDKKINNFDTRANSATDLLSLSNAETFDKNYKMAMKEFDDYEKLSALLFFSSSEYLQTPDSQKIYNTAILHDLIERGKPENENYKNDFMFYILNLPKLKNDYLYYSVSPDELLDYIKNDTTRLKINKKNVQSDSKLKDYLKISKKYDEVLEDTQEQEDLEKRKWLQIL